MNLSAPALLRVFFFLLLLVASQGVAAIEFNGYANSAAALAACKQRTDAFIASNGALVPRGNPPTTLYCAGPYTDHGTPYYMTFSRDMWDDYHYLAFSCPAGETQNAAKTGCICPAGKERNPHTNSCETPCDGSTVEPIPSQFPEADGTLYCSITPTNSYCASIMGLPDSQHMTTIAGAFCSPSNFSQNCPEGYSAGSASQFCLPIDSDEDGVPDTEDEFPNDPTKQKDTDSDGVDDNQDTAPDDPENGEDDGTGNETDNQATGGASCTTAPTCKGDGIMCNQLFQQWKTRCEVEKLKDIEAGEAEGTASTATGAGGSCSAAPTCQGDSVQCATYLETRKARCVAEANGGGTTTVVVGLEQPDWTKVPDPADPATGQQAGDAPGLKTASVGVSSLDQTGWMGASVPSIPPVMLPTLGVEFLGETPPFWADFINTIRAILLALFAWRAVRILSGGE